MVGEFIPTGIAVDHIQVVPQQIHGKIRFLHRVSKGIEHHLGIFDCYEFERQHRKVINYVPHQIIRGSAFFLGILRPLPHLLLGQYAVSPIGQCLSGFITGCQHFTFKPCRIF